LRCGTVLKESEMNVASASTAISVAFAVLLAGCQHGDGAAVTLAPSEAPLRAASSRIVAPRSTTDRSLPDAASVFEPHGASATISNIAAVQQQALPQEKMTKEEESMAMPLPGQANDHSSLALDWRSER
jgi:hypothetical protein